MKIRTYLLVTYFIILGLLALGMLAISDMTICTLSSCNLRSAQHAIGQLNERNYELSKNVLTTYGERLVETKAEETAKELSLLLAGKESYDYDQMRKDPELKRMATRPLETWNGVAGYLSLADRHGISVLHPDESVQGTNLIKWKDQYPDFWKLVQESFVQKEVKGYYTFIDNENRPRKRYQVRVHVPGTPFVAVAIVNIDDYFAPVQELMKDSESNAVEQIQASIGESTGSSRHKMFAIAAGSVTTLFLMAGVIAFGFARILSKPITGLRDAVQSMGTGDLQVQVPEQGAKEMKELAQSFNELGVQLNDYIARRDFVRDTFGRYMTSEVADKLLESKEALVLGGEVREITILMSDVRGFSALAAEMRPDDLIEILNSYLSRMIDTLLEFEGVVNEIIGDGILAFFGAPTDMKDHPARAVACALKMQRVLEEVNAHNKELGRPSLEMGIAVVTGKVVVGNIGSDKRCKYGAVGANMNLAGRMESLAVGGQVLITRATYERVADMVLLQNSFSVELKGLPEPVEIYDVMGIAGPYGIHLKPVHDRVVELDTPIRAVFQKLSEKVVDQEERDVAISQISLKGAVFSSRFDLAVRDDLRCTLASHESLGAACQIYAKVECVELWGGANRVTVRFTSLSKDAEMFIRRLCEADKANYRYNLAAMGAPARMDVQ